MTRSNDEASHIFESANDGAGPDIATEIDNGDFDALMRARDAKAAAEAQLHAAIAEARRHGATWQAIGAVLGVSRQAVHAKYGAA